MKAFEVVTPGAMRCYHADNENQARKQHTESFPDEQIDEIYVLEFGCGGDGCGCPDYSIPRR
jgi:hypothetical protein